MANGILRKISVGIAEETGGYGVDPGAATFVLANVDLSWEDKGTYVDNESMLGSTYINSNSSLAFKMMTFTMSFKLDEDSFPLIMKQKFSIVSAAAAGETVVYDHTLTYANTNFGTSYSLYWQDDDRTDLVASGAKFESVNLSLEAGNYIMVEITGTSIYPVDGAVTNTIASLREFLGKNTTFQLSDFGVGLAAYEALTIEMKHEFGMSGEEVNIPLGSEDVTNLFTLGDNFELEVNALMPDNTIRNDHRDGTKQVAQVDLTDTSRFVVGSVANTNPAVIFDYPKMAIIDWSRDGGADDILRNNFTLRAEDYPGVADAPLKITVTNAIASY